MNSATVDGPVPEKPRRRSRAALEQRLAQLEREAEGLRRAHAVLAGRRWFVIYGEEEKVRTLFFLSEAGAHPACSIGKGAVILIGYPQNTGEAP